MIQISDTQTAAKLGPNHGYRIEGDIALLHADVAVATDLDHRHSHWALQLWACDTPFNGGSLSGVKIAEATLPVPEGVEPQRMDAEAPASLPVGQRDYSMVLVLASGAPGSFDQIHDFANYPARERFVTPHLEGSVGYQIDGDEVVIRAERVRNPRGAGNLSGSLALELWALPEAYDGTHTFSGTLLANADLGRIAGGDTLEGFERRVHFSAPNAGRWHVVLMLREWAVGGYVTRDYCTFAEPYLVAEPITAAETVTLAETIEIAAAKPAAEPAAVLPQALTANSNGAKVSRPVIRWQPDYERDVSATTPGGVRAPTIKPNDAKVSVMRASVEELAAVKGLTRKLAQEIVKGRPYSNLDELVRVRGIGPKLLVKLRSLITL